MIALAIALVAWLAFQCWLDVFVAGRIPVDSPSWLALTLRSLAPRTRARAVAPRDVLGERLLTFAAAYALFEELG